MAIVGAFFDTGRTLAIGAGAVVAQCRKEGLAGFGIFALRSP